MIRDIIREWKSGGDRGDTNVLIAMLEDGFEREVKRRVHSARYSARRSERPRDMRAEYAAVGRQH